MQADRHDSYNIVYSNGFSLMMSDHDFKINFGTTEGGSPDTVVESVGVFMTHRTLKLLARSLNLIVDNFEKSSGSEIDFDESKLAVFDTE